MIELLNITATKARDKEIQREADLHRRQLIQREADLHRRQLVIRAARPADEPSLRRLTQLDGQTHLDPADALVAEVDGEMLAALPLDGRPAVANPFRPTAELVEMLELRASQLRWTNAPSGGRVRRIWDALRGGATQPMLAPLAGDVSLPPRHDGE